MKKIIYRALVIFIGVIVGFFLGLTLGQLLGAIIGGMFDLLGFEINNASEVVFGGLIGVLVAVILGGGLLYLGKMVFPTFDNLNFGMLVTTIIGLALGIHSGSSFRGMIGLMNFIIFGTGVGLWVGGAVGIFIGILISLKASTNSLSISDEEKEKNEDYAQYLRTKARRK